MDHIVQSIKAELAAQADDKIKQSSQRFFKEEIKVHGLKSAAVNKIGKQVWRKIKEQPKKQIFTLCEKLMSSGYLEESSLAAMFAHNLKEQYELQDFKIFSRWINNYISNWAACDTFCNHAVGDFVQKYPQVVEELKKFTRSPNRWVQRAAAVSLIIPARRGLFLEDIFVIAQNLLDSPDDMVQKGYGWMLKAASQAHPQAVFDYLMAHKAVMPRTAFRYALEKMPQEWRAQAMAS